MAADPPQLARELFAHRRAFQAFLAARVGSEAEAEDILQQSLAKALRHAPALRDEERLVAWFYQTLRHALIDHYRSRAADRRRHAALGTLVAALGDDHAPAPGVERQLCACLAGVLATLKPAPAALLRRVDLEGGAVQEVARELGLTPNAASVTLHRARKELRARLQAVCGPCADGACLDCDCAPADEGN